MFTSGLCIFEYTKERHRFHLPQLETGELERFIRRYNQGDRNSAINSSTENRREQDTQTVLETETENL